MWIFLIVEAVRKKKVALLLVTDGVVQHGNLLGVKFQQFLQARAAITKDLKFIFCSFF